MKPSNTEIVIEAGSDTAEVTGRNPMFPPAQIKLRGLIDVDQIKEPLARMSRFARHKFPGQRLHFDPASKKAWVEETLYQDGYRPQRDAIARFYSLPERTKDISGDHDVATWLFWMKRLVDSGLARLVSGEFPDPLPPNPKMEFFGQELKSNEERKIDKLTAMVQALAALQLANLPEAKRREVEALLK